MLGVGMLMVTIWLELCIILDLHSCHRHHLHRPCSNIIQNYGNDLSGLSWEMAVKRVTCRVYGLNFHIDEVVPRRSVSRQLWKDIPISRVRIGPERTGTAFRFFFLKPERRSGSFFENSERKSDSCCCVHTSVLPSVAVLKLRLEPLHYSLH